MCLGLCIKYPLFFSDFNTTRVFSIYFLKNTQIQHFMKSLPLGAELFRADTQTDMTKLIVKVNEGMEEIA